MRSASQWMTRWPASHYIRRSLRPQLPRLGRSFGVRSQPQALIARHFGVVSRDIRPRRLEWRCVARRIYRSWWRRAVALALMPVLVGAATAPNDPGCFETCNLAQDLATLGIQVVWLLWLFAAVTIAWYWEPALSAISAVGAAAF